MGLVGRIGREPYSVGQGPQTAVNRAEQLEPSLCVREVDVEQERQKALSRAAGSWHDCSTAKFCERPLIDSPHAYFLRSIHGK